MTSYTQTLIMLTGNDLLTAVQNLPSMTEDFSQKRFVDLGQIIFQDLVKGYHDTLHGHDNDDGGYGEVQDHTLPYKWFAEMSFEAAEGFAKVFRHQEDN